MCTLTKLYTLECNLTMSKKRKDIWIYDNDLRKVFRLTCMEALLLCIIEQTICRWKGCCYLGNRFFIDKIGVTEFIISKALKKLVGLGVIWMDNKVMTTRGIERHIVIPKSASKYRKFLVKSHCHHTLNKFKKDVNENILFH